jgi:hypothetical protein
MAGRPTKYTAVISDVICESLRSGTTRTGAVAAANIAYDTFGEWMEHKPDFRYAVLRAEAEAENEMVKVLRSAAPDDWRAAESWLKRRRRDDWGDTVKSEISGPSGEAIRIRHEMANLAELSDDELLRLHSETLGSPG